MIGAKFGYMVALVGALGVLGLLLTQISSAEENVRTPTAQVVSVTAAATATTSTTTSTSSAPLVKLNDQFRAIYKDEKNKLELVSYPVIVAIGDRIMLFRGAADKQEKCFIPAQWTLLKTVDHLPLAIFVLLRTQTGRATLPVDVVEKLQNMDNLAGEAQMEIVSTKTLPAVVLARQRSIIEQSRRFMQEVARAKQVSGIKLAGFINRMSPLSMQNADDAERLELSELDKVVQQWKQELSASDWHRLQVVIVGQHMPRLRERRFQYFAQLLNEKVEGQRIVYMEGAGTVDDALELLATHNLDRQISREYFHINDRMHRDLLSDSARRYLQKHPPNRALPARP